MKLTIHIPESLKDIKLNQYQKWLKIAEGKEMNNFIQQKMIEIFCNIPLNKVLQIKATDVNNICESINKVFTEKPKLIDRFKKDNIEFGFIPKLDDMIFGEYVDLNTYLPEWETMDKAMSVLYRPIIYNKNKQYLIEDYNTSSKYNLKDITLDIVFGAIVFFWSLKNELQNHILNYLANQKEVTIPQHLVDSLKNGAGINQYMGWPMEILES